MKQQYLYTQLFTIVISSEHEFVNIQGNLILRKQIPYKVALLEILYIQMHIKLISEHKQINRTIRQLTFSQHN